MAACAWKVSEARPGGRARAGADVPLADPPLGAELRRIRAERDLGMGEDRLLPVVLLSGQRDPLVERPVAVLRVVNRASKAIVSHSCSASVGACW